MYVLPELVALHVLHEGRYGARIDLDEEIPRCRSVVEERIANRPA